MFVILHYEPKHLNRHWSPHKHKSCTTKWHCELHIRCTIQLTIIVVQDFEPPLPSYHCSYQSYATLLYDKICAIKHNFWLSKVEENLRFTVDISNITLHGMSSCKSSLTWFSCRWWCCIASWWCCKLMVLQSDGACRWWCCIASSNHSTEWMYVYKGRHHTQMRVKHCAKQGQSEILYTLYWKKYNLQILQ